jgi:hypothetical protein
MEPNQLIDMDWILLRDLFVCWVVLPWTVLLFMRAIQRFDNYLLKKFDERKSRKAR